MIYAVPCNNTIISNHFSRSQQIAIIDIGTHRIEFISTSQCGSHCNVKKQWLKLVADYKVDTVILRNVGKNMLRSLFQAQVKVLAAPAKLDIQSLNFAQLTEIESLDYAKESPNKKPCCSHQKPSHALTPSKPSWHTIKRIR